MHCSVLSLICVTCRADSARRSTAGGLGEGRATHVASVILGEVDVPLLSGQTPAR